MCPRLALRYDYVSLRPDRLIDRKNHPVHVRARLEGGGYIIIGCKPEECAATMKHDYERGGRMVKAAVNGGLSAFGLGDTLKVWASRAG